MSEILSEIFERRLSLDGGNDIESSRWDVAIDIWQGMSDKLDEIAANTRKNIHAGGITTSRTRKSTTSRSGGSNVSPVSERRTTKRLPTERTSTGKQAAQSTAKKQSVRTSTATRSQAASQQRQTTAVAQENTKKRATTPTEAQKGTEQGKLSGQSKKNAQNVSVSPAQSATPVITQVNPAGQGESVAAAGKTKSAESLEKHRSEAIAKEQGKNLAQTFKDNLKNWDGSIFSNRGDDAIDAAGIAADGPIYAAVKEVAQVLDDATKDENSLAGTLRKTLEDKTGITAAKDKLGGLKQSAIKRIASWAGVEQSKLQANQKGKRDSKGRFIRKDPAVEEQLELAEQSVAIATKEAQADDKRHKEILRAIKGVDSGGGLLENALGRKLGNMLGGRGRRGAKGASGRVRGKVGRKGKVKGKGKGGLFSRLKGKAGKIAKGAGKVALGAGAVGTGLLAGSEKLGKTARTPTGVDVTTKKTTQVATEETAKKSTVKATEKATEKTVAKSASEAIEKPVAKASEAVTEKAAEKATEKTTEKVAAKTSAEATEKAAAKAGSEATEKAAVKASEAVEKPVVKASTEATEKTVAKATETTAEKSVAKASEVTAEKAAEKSVAKVGGEVAEKTAVKAGGELAEKSVAKVGGEVAEKGAVKAGEKLTAKGIAKGAGAVGAKALATGARAIPILGQALSIGMAAYDAYSGWNDEEMHKQAFGLGEGEEATTGQKAAAAIANLVDMGGLLTGGASLLGFDVDTADLAKGLYGIFGGSNKKENAEQETEAQAATAEAAESAANAQSVTAQAAESAAGAQAAATEAASAQAVAEEAAANAQAAAAKVAEPTNTETQAVASEAAKGINTDALAVGVLAAGTVGAGALAARSLSSGKTTGTQPVAVGSEKPTGKKTGTGKAVGIAAGVVAGGVAAGIAGNALAGENTDAQPAAETPTPPVAVESAATAAPTITAQKEGEKPQVELPSTLTSTPDTNTKKVFDDLLEAVKDIKNFVIGVDNENRTNILMQQAGGGGYSGGGGGYSSDFGSVTPEAQAAAGTIPGQELGGLAAKYESGHLGSSAIGWDTTGGTSYGRYQIATRTGTMNAFLNWAEKNGGAEGKEVAARMRATGNLDSGKNGRSAQEWQALAKEGKISKLEHGFIKATHYDAAMAGIKSPELKKRIEQSRTLQEMVWSTSIGHGAGGARKLINSVYKEGMSDEDLIRAVYAERGNRYQSSTAQVQKAVKVRFGKEASVALAMMEAEKKGGSPQAVLGTPQAPVSAKNTASSSTVANPVKNAPQAATSAGTATPSVAAPAVRTASAVQNTTPVSIPAMPKPTVASVEPVRQIAPPTEREKPASDKEGLDRIEKLLKAILFVMQGGKIGASGGGKSVNIGMDFDDPAARSYASM